MNTPLVSIIVPIWNTSKYLPTCLDSILNQTHKNFELILIDDGSTDDSGKICDNYAKKDSRIKVIHQKNAGQSAGRNRGLKLATGEFISFIDSDDHVEPTFLADLLAAYASKISLVACGLHYTKLQQNSTDNVYLEPRAPRKPSESKATYVLKLLSLDGRLYAVTNKLFRAKFAKSCHFDEKLNFAEDTKFVLDYLKKSPGEIAFVLKPLYAYYLGTDTSTIKSSGIIWRNWQTSFQNLKAWAGKNPSLSERFWLSVVHLRWRISYLRAKRRSQKTKN